MATHSRSPLLALLLCLVMGAAPLPAMAGATSAASLTSAAKREVFGFFTATERDYMLNVANYDILTTVAFFSLEARADGTLAKTTSSGAATSTWAAWNSAWMDQVIAKAHAHGTKVVLTVTRFGWTAADRAAMTELLSSPSRRAQLAAEIADVVGARGVDGVNLDFEPMFADIAAQFVDFVRKVRAALDAKQPGLYLTFDATGHGSNYDITALTASDAADAVFIMGYDYHHAGSQRAGAVSPLGGVTYDLRATLDRYLAKATPDKVILGLPYYGREWSTETKYRHSLTWPAGPTRGYPRSRRLDEAIRLGKQYRVRWSAEQQVPWTRWRERACASCPLTWRQLYYDNRRSLGLKYDLIRQRNLAGVGFWRIGMEGNRPKLYKLIREKLGP